MLVIPVGLVIVKRFAESVEDKTTLVPLIPPSPVTPVTPIVPVIPTFTPQEQQAFTRERILAPSGTPEQAKMLAESGAIRQGKVTPLGFRQGETTDDLLRRLFNNPK